MHATHTQTTVLAGLLLLERVRAAEDDGLRFPHDNVPNVASESSHGAGGTDNLQMSLGHVRDEDSSIHRHWALLVAGSRGWGAGSAERCWAVCSCCVFSGMALQLLHTRVSSFSCSSWEL